MWVVDQFGEWRRDGHNPASLPNAAVAIKGNVLQVDIPFTSTHAFYLSRARTGVKLATYAVDLYEPGFNLDPRGVYSMLQFGTIVPPFSPWKEVVRLRPGFNYEIRADGSTIETPRVNVTTHSGVSCVDHDKQIQYVTTTIDKILQAACPTGAAAILFSGGVDSGLLAARAAALGWKDSVLINYAMGKKDPESLAAEAMAEQLGLRFVRIYHDEDDSLRILDVFAAESPQPFADHSVFPTRRLCRIAQESFDFATVIDGTGADGCFGLFGRAARFKRLYEMPAALRHIGRRLYNSAKIWAKRSPFEPPLRILCRSSKLPWLCAAIAQNPLAGILYAAHADIQAEVCHALYDWIKQASPSSDDDVTLAAADLVLVCANIYAQKSQPLFDQKSNAIAYPFLHEDMLRLALSEARGWHGHEGESKGILKAALAKHVSEDLVYRKKVGFTAPIERMFCRSPFLHQMRRLSDASAPLAPWLDTRAIAALEREVGRGRPLPVQTANATWAIVSGNMWLEHAMTRDKSVRALGQSGIARS